jgi:hypothetical protein
VAQISGALAAFPISGSRVELLLLDFLCQLNASNRHGGCLESAEPEHRPDTLLYSPVILLDHIVEVFAGSHLHAARYIPAFLSLASARCEAA